MSSGYSANQFDSAFKPHRLQNWCKTKHFKERPTAQLGHSTFIADNRGHLLPGYGKRGSAWPDYKGTWNLSAHTSGQRINPTARSVEGLNRLKARGMYLEPTGTSEPHSGTKSTNRLQSSGKVLQDGATPSAAAEARSASQNHLTTGNEMSTNQSQAGSEAAEQATEKERLLTQCSVAEDKPAVTPAASEGIHSRPDTGEERPTSNVSAKAASQAPPPSSKHTQRDVLQDQ